MDITVAYILIRAIIGVAICVTFGFLQYRYRSFNLIYILLGFFVGGGLFCLIFADEILYILITIYFIFGTATVAAIRLIQFIKDYKSRLSKKNDLKT